MPAAKSLLQHFPKHLTPRTMQRNVLLELEKQWDTADIFILNMPVASGKSACATSIASWQKKASLIVPNKLLVDQYSEEYPYLHLLRAKSDYWCSTFKGPVSKRPKSKKLGTLCAKELGCDGCNNYRSDLRKARVMPYILSNYHIYFTHKLYRGTLIIDECFLGNTNVHTETGLTTIGSIYRKWKRGEKIMVKSFNQETESFEYKQVTYGWKRPTTKHLYKAVTSGNKEVTATENHPVLTTEGYRPIKELQVGDDIVIYSESRLGLRLPEDLTRQVIAGSILGDGYWRQDSHCTSGKRLTIRHGKKQLDYLKFKADILEVEVNESSASGYTGEAQYICQTGYINDAGLRTKQDALDSLDNRGLMVWFADDGSTSQNKSGSITARFHTESWALEDVRYAITTLKETFNIDASIAWYKDGKYPYIQLNTKDTEKLLSTIGPLLPESMKYKLKTYESGTVDLTGTTGYKSYRTVRVVEVVDLGPTTEAVYDIEVADNHNFVVASRSKFAHKNGVVVHNCHKVVELLKDLASKKLWQFKYRFPSHLRTRADITKWVNGLDKNAFFKHHTPGGDTKYQQQDLLTFLKDELNSYRPKYVVSVETEAFKDEEYKCIKMSPVDISSSPPILWPSSVKKVVLMSGTISRKDVEQMGLSSRRVKYIEAGSPIPAENRPVVIPEQAASMAYKNAQASLPKLLKFIENVAAHHEEDKGLVHITYSLAKQLKRLEIPAPLKSRLIFHDKYSKGTAYRQFRETEEPAILVASGMYEGIDLKADAGRWQIISKTPWPSLADPAIKFMAEADRDWYIWQAWKDLSQACGRICRTPTDFGATYVFDSTFQMLYRQAKQLGYVPQWFQDSVEYVGE